jgi:hypothetical protein
MGDIKPDISSLLRADFGEEADAGFPRLSRIPQTRVVQLLDYFAGLNPGEQSELLDSLASRGAVMLNLSRGDSFPPSSAFDRFWEAVTSQGPFTGGFRYCDVKFLASVPKMREFGSHERWVEEYQKPWVSELALTPRSDLLPDMGCLKAAKGRFLKKLVKAEFETGGFIPEVVKGAEHTFVSSAGDKVRVDYGSYMGQICYGVSAARGSVRIFRLSFESLWSIAGGWDYLTEENAARSVELLPKLVEYLIELTERVGRLR